MRLKILLLAHQIIFVESAQASININDVEISTEYIEKAVEKFPKKPQVFKIENFEDYYPYEFKIPKEIIIYPIPVNENTVLIGFKSNFYTLPRIRNNC